MFTKELRICLAVAEKQNPNITWYIMPTLSLRVENMEEVQEFCKNLPDVSKMVEWIDNAFLMAMPSSNSTNTFDLLKQVYVGSGQIVLIKEEMGRMSGRETVGEINAIDLETNTHLIDFENEKPYVLTEKDKEAVDAMNTAINSMIHIRV